MPGISPPYRGGPCRARRARVRSLSLNPHARKANMSTVRLNYDGWLALPAAVRQKFGLVTGDQLDLELSDDAIILRPRRTGGVVEQQAPEPPVASAEPTASAPPPAAAAA